MAGAPCCINMLAEKLAKSHLTTTRESQLWSKVWGESQGFSQCGAAAEDVWRWWTALTHLWASLPLLNVIDLQLSGEGLIQGFQIYFGHRCSDCRHCLFGTVWVTFVPLRRLVPAGNSACRSNTRKFLMHSGCHVLLMQLMNCKWGALSIKWPVSTLETFNNYFLDTEWESLNLKY